MKHILILFLFFTIPCLYAQEPIDTVQVKSEVPDSLCVTIKDERVCFPTKDAQETEKLIAQFIEENDGKWPTTAVGWIVLILGTIAGGRYVAVWSNATKIYYFLKEFLKETLHVVAFVSGIIAAGLTFLVGLFTKELFAWSVFMMVWPWAALISVYVYEKWIKKPDFVEPVSR